MTKEAERLMSAIARWFASGRGDHREVVLESGAYLASLEKPEPKRSAEGLIREHIAWLDHQEFTSGSWAGLREALALIRADKERRHWAAKKLRSIWMGNEGDLREVADELEREP
jgi:hypothetical protein